jgi:uncharacterized protein
MRTITLEEHFATPGFLDGPGRDLKDQARQVGSRAERLMRDLCDIGEGRIVQMDAAGIDMQVVSLTAPGVEQLEAAEAVALARDTNDALAEAIAKRPTRLSGFAALPIAAPDQAAKELERRFSGQAFAGALINGHQRGRYLDDKFFWPVLEAAESLGAPIYLHPTRPPKPVIEASFGGFAPLVTEMLAGPGFGWHIETAVRGVPRQYVAKRSNPNGLLGLPVPVLPRGRPGDGRTKREHQLPWLMPQAWPLTASAPFRSGF